MAGEVVPKLPDNFFAQVASNAQMARRALGPNMQAVVAGVILTLCAIVIGLLSLLFNS